MHFQTAAKNVLQIWSFCMNSVWHWNLIQNLQVYTFGTNPNWLSFHLFFIKDRNKLWKKLNYIWIDSHALVWAQKFTWNIPCRKFSKICTLLLKFSNRTWNIKTGIKENMQGSTQRYGLIICTQILYMCQLTSWKIKVKFGTWQCRKIDVGSVTQTFCTISLL